MTKALEALLANHKHHQDYDDYGGYAGSELEQQNLEAIATLQQTELPPLPVCTHSTPYPGAKGDFLYTVDQMHAYALQSIVPEGHAIVPLIPNEVQWGELARKIMLAFDMNAKTPTTLINVLKNSGFDIPQWMRDELKNEAPDHVMSKGTRVTLIYRAMVEAARQQKV